MSESQTVAFQKLKVGFELAVVSTALAVALPFLLALVLPLVPLVIIVYLFGVYVRSKGWKILGFDTTQNIMRSCAVAIVLSPVWLGYPVISFVYSETQASISMFSLILVGLWMFYTCAEHLSLRKIEKKFDLNFKTARILLLIGIIVYLAAYAYELSLPYAEALLAAVEIPFFAGAFALPFLILSSLMIIRNIKQRGKPPVVTS